MAYTFMKKKITFLLLFCSILICNQSIYAQDSMIPDVDYAFLQKLIDTAKLYYPKMKAYEKRVIIAKDNIKREKRGWGEFVNFSMSYSPSNTVTATGLSLSGYQIGFGFNIAAVLQRPFIIKQAKNEYAIAKLDIAEYHLNLEAEVKRRYFLYIQQRAILKSQSSSIIDLNAVVKQSKYRFEKGEESLENYSKALVALTGQKQVVIAAEGAVLTAKSTLEELLGKKLEDIH